MLCTSPPFTMPDLPPSHCHRPPPLVFAVWQLLVFYTRAKDEVNKARQLYAAATSCRTMVRGHAAQW